MDLALFLIISSIITKSCIIVGLCNLTPFFLLYVIPCSEIRLTISTTYTLTLCRYKLKDAILEGGVTFQKAHEGITFFDYLEKDTHLAELLSHAMDGSIATSMAILLQTYRGFEGVKEVVNVGGAHGATLSCIVAMNPHLKGINFDLPHIIKNAPAMPDCQVLINSTVTFMFRGTSPSKTLRCQRKTHDRVSNSRIPSNLNSDL